MRPTPDQIRRARLVSLWRRNTRHWTYPGERFHDYDPVEVMESMGRAWPLDDFYNGPDLRPDQYSPNLPYTGASARERVISNRPTRLDVTIPQLELPDEFPY